MIVIIVLNMWFNLKRCQYWYSIFGCVNSRCEIIWTCTEMDNSYPNGILRGTVTQNFNFCLVLGKHEMTTPKSMKTICFLWVNWWWVLGSDYHFLGHARFKRHANFHQDTTIIPMEKTCLKKMKMPISAQNGYVHVGDIKSHIAIG